MSNEYVSLERSTNEIRILRLESGQGEEDIRGTLEIVPIDLAPSYEALSYAWGDPGEKPKDISIDGRPFPVTENLYTALVYLRSSEVVRILWIDAVCINQTDNAERLYQVQMMDAIYKQASVVLVWLGAPMDDSDAAIDVIQKIVDARNRIIQAFPDDFVGEDLSGVAVNLAKLPTEPFDDLATMLSSITELLRRNYWYRIWVVQEAAISSRDPVIGCGHKWMPWSDLCSGLFELKTRLRHLHDTRKWGVDSHERPFYRNFLLARHNLFDMNNIRNSIQHGYVNKPRYQSHALVSGTNILDLLWHTRSKKYSDPRDRVYSLLGLFRWMKSQRSVEITVTADYTSSLHSVYAEITRMTIEIEGNLEILNLKDHVSADFLPSWTPNYSSQPVESFPTLSPNTLQPWIEHLACRHKSLTFKWKHAALNRSKSKRLEELTVVGRTFDSIRLVIDLTDFDEFPLGRIRSVHQACMEVYDSIFPSLSPTANADLTEAIWRSLVADRADGFGSPCRSSHGDLYKQILGDTMDPDDEVSDVEPFLHDVRRAIYYFPEGPRRQFIVSQDGHFGLSPPDCGVGDLLCVFQNFSMPAVLRKNGDFYTFQGTAYVHNAMKGEEYPIDDTDLEEFVLR